jgi:hypothetical protein
MKKIAITLITCLASSVVAEELPEASFYSSARLDLLCRTDRAAASTYIAGLNDAAAHAASVMEVFRDGTRQSDVNIRYARSQIAAACMPRATLEQMTEAFCGYLKRFPEVLDRAASVTFSDAMAKTWPCK